MYMSALVAVLMGSWLWLCPILLRTGNRGETPKPPWFTKCGQEPNGMKLSSTTLPYQDFACLSSRSGSLQVSLGQRVTAWGSIHLDRVARKLPKV
jgi:hypothetical protein